MYFSRKNQILSLEKIYESNKNEVIVFYSDEDSDIYDVLHEFLNGKDYYYYNAVQVSADEQLKLFVNSINAQLSKASISEFSYSDALKAMMNSKCEKRVVVINEFQHIIKYSDALISEILKCVSNICGNQPVLFILMSSNSYFVENQMIDKLNEYAYELSGLIKLQDLSFVDIVKYFDNYSKENQVLSYGITGGKYSRIVAFDPNLSLKDNIISEVLNKNGKLYSKGMNILPAELREHSVYNTILLNIARGFTKLNELHKNTGYSRAKISVYLNNLIEHNIIEKIDSYDTEGRENSLKGIYNIKDGFVTFFYRFVYPNVSVLSVIGEKEYYKKYIEPYLYDYGAKTFKKVCTEYLMILNKINKLPYKISESGTWLGKFGNVDIVCSDNNENIIIGNCEFVKNIITFEDYEWMKFCAESAKLTPNVIYLFSRKGFDDRLLTISKESSNLFLIDLSMF